jgi:protein involved in polysaccharide export with SLBB domain
MHDRSKCARAISHAVVAAFCAAIIAACAPAGTMRVTASQRGGVGEAGDGIESAGGSRKISARDVVRLEKLWEQRSQGYAANQSYPLGPGDVLEISVPQLDEIQQRKVRVSAMGTIELPMAGTVEAGGLTEDELAQKLNGKFERFMYVAQASVFVAEYRNREVAVVGAVNRPGLVQLYGSAPTLLDVITQAGGLAPSAADELILIPAQPGDARSTSRANSQASHSNSAYAVSAPDTVVASAATSRAASEVQRESAVDTGLGDGGNGIAPVPDAGTGLPMARNAEAISIPLRSTSLKGAGRYLSMPARPGDVLVVPGGGEVMVVGWVHNPGHFAVGSGLTVLGAIGEAGGPMYAADIKEVTLIRNGEDGSKEAIALNLDGISSGRALDIPVKANDVVDVPYSGWRIGPYIFYSVVTRIGLNGPAIPY